jgi:hypothetical protein
MLLRGELSPTPLLEEELKRMKKTIVRIILVAFLLLTSGAAPLLADGGEPVPLCYPRPCPVK